MQDQIIPISNGARIVNENHDRYVRHFERQEFAQQSSDGFLDGLICAVVGTAATILWLTFML